MSATLDILTETVCRLFEENGGDGAARAARNGGDIGVLWRAVAELGLPLGLLDEAQGGFGLSPAEILPMIRISGRHGAPVPLSETLLANWILAQSGLPLAEGMATFALAPGCSVQPDGDTVRVSGDAAWVPWGAQAGTVVVIVGDTVVSLEAGDFRANEAAGDNRLPRADLTFDVKLAPGRLAQRPAALSNLVVKSAGSLSRALEMAGAASTILEITVAYANERTQFGRPLGRFQAIQQQLAIMADEVAAANAVCDLAVSGWMRSVEPMVAAVAKVRAGEAAAAVAAIAHQVLGAIGFTEEHRLQIFTRSLWLWRNEYGSEREWSSFLGASALAGEKTLWAWATGPDLLGEAA